MERDYILLVQKLCNKTQIFPFPGFCDFVKKTTFVLCFWWFLYFLHFCLFFHFCHNFWANWGIDLFSTSKWLSEHQFCEKYLCRWQRNRLEMVVKQPFLSVTNFDYQSICTNMWAFTKKIFKINPKPSKK